MTVANKITRYAWGADCVTGLRYVTFERSSSGNRTRNDPSTGSWTRLMRALTVSRVKPKLKQFLRQHAMMEYIDRKVATAQKKRV